MADNAFLKLFSQPSPPIEVRGFRPDPMARQVQDWLSLSTPWWQYGQMPEEFQTKLIQKYGTPKEKAEQSTDQARAAKYGTIRAPRWSDPGEFAATGGGIISSIKAIEALKRLPPKMMSPEVLRTKLLQAGAAKGELEMAGFETFVKDIGPQQTKYSKPGFIHPFEVAEHLEKNPARIEERVLGGQGLPYLSQAELAEYSSLRAIIEDYSRVNPGPVGDMRTLADQALEPDKADRFRGLLERFIAERGSEEAHQVGGPRFSSPDLSLPGGENYREILLKAPEGPTAAEDRRLIAHLQKVSNSDRANLTLDEQQALDAALDRQRGGFLSSHFPDDPNLFAHLRVNDRTLPATKLTEAQEKALWSEWEQVQGELERLGTRDAPERAGLERRWRILQDRIEGRGGEKALHVEEFQSDWALQAREAEKLAKEHPKEYTLGYGKYEDGTRSTWTFSTKEAAEAKKAELQAQFPEVKIEIEEIDSYIPEVRSHPLVSNWQDIASRRALKEAVDGGYDRLTWVTGQQTADRYDLSKRFKEISYFKNNDGTYDLHGLFEQGGVEDATQLASRVPREKLADYVGKDVAEKILLDKGKAVKSATIERSMDRALDTAEARDAAVDDAISSLRQTLVPLRDTQGRRFTDTWFDRWIEDLVDDDRQAIRHLQALYPGNTVVADRLAAIADTLGLETTSVARGKTLSNLDLRVGGEWATKLYDESMVNRFNKIGKRFGVKVEDIESGAPQRNKQELESLFSNYIRGFADEGLLRNAEIGEEVRDLVRAARYSFGQGDEKAAQVAVKALADIAEQHNVRAVAPLTLRLEEIADQGLLKTGGKIHSLPITPEMRAALKGQEVHPFADFDYTRKAGQDVKALQAEAAKLGVEWKGSQGKLKSGHEVFVLRDPQTGSAFSLEPGESVADALKRVRERFNKTPGRPGPGATERELSLEEWNQAQGRAAEREVKPHLAAFLKTRNEFGRYQLELIAKGIQTALKRGEQAYALEQVGVLLRADPPVTEEGARALARASEAIAEARPQLGRDIFPGLHPKAPKDPLARGLRRTAVKAIKIVEELADTPERKALFAELKPEIEKVLESKMTRELWLGGSYASGKPDPSDIDLFLKPVRGSFGRHSTQEKLHTVTPTPFPGRGPWGWRALIEPALREAQRRYGKDYQLIRLLQLVGLVGVGAVVAPEEESQ